MYFEKVNKLLIFPAKFQMDPKWNLTSEITRCPVKYCDNQFMVEKNDNGKDKGCSGLQLLLTKPTFNIHPSIAITTTNQPCHEAEALSAALVGLTPGAFVPDAGKGSQGFA